MKRLGANVSVVQVEGADKDAVGEQCALYGSGSRIADNGGCIAVSESFANCRLGYICGLASYGPECAAKRVEKHPLGRGDNVRRQSLIPNGKPKFGKFLLKGGFLPIALASGQR
jgi:hypothetical protein